MSTRIIALALALVIALSLCACTKAPNKEYNDVPSKDSIGSTIDKDLNNDATNDEKNEDVESEKEEGVPAPKDDAVINNATEVTPGKYTLNEYENVKIKCGGEYSFTGNLQNGMIYVNTVEKVKITLRDARISNENGPCVYVHNAHGVEIELIGVNAISSGGRYVDENIDAAIYIDTKATFAGDGSLDIKSTINKGIKGESHINILGGNFTILSTDDCINAEKNLTIDNGCFKLTSIEEKGIKSGSTMEVNGGIFTLDTCGDALRAEETLIINDGTIDVQKCDEGLESKGSMFINGGKITIHSADDSINAIVELKITGGDLYLTSDGNDAIDGNDKLTITGGKIYATATSRGEGAIDTAQDGLFVSGGTVIGVGRVNSSRNLGNGNILIVTPGTDEIVNEIKIVDEYGNVVFTCEIEPYVVIKNPESTDNDSTDKETSGPTLQRPIVVPPIHRIPRYIKRIGKIPGPIITPPHPPKIINEILKQTIINKNPNIKPVENKEKVEPIFRNQFDNVDIGAASFFITFPGLVNGTYDVYLNGNYNETIIVENIKSDGFVPLSPK